MSTVRWIQSVTIHYEQFIIFYYVSEYQLPPAIGTSYTTPITGVNQSPMLLKLIGWRHCPCYKWVAYIPWITTSVSWHWNRRTARYLVTVIVISQWKLWNNNSTDGISVIPQEPCSETLSRLRYLYPRSTQNTDAIFFIYFPNPSVSYLLHYLIQLNSQYPCYLEYWDNTVTVTVK